MNEEEEYFLEEEEEEDEESKSDSFNDTANTLSQDCQISSGSVSEDPSVVAVTGSRPLKKSTAFHDRDTLEQQVGRHGMSETFYPKICFIFL